MHPIFDIILHTGLFQSVAWVFAWLRSSVRDLWRHYWGLERKMIPYRIVTVAIAGALVRERLWKMVAGGIVH